MGGHPPTSPQKNRPASSRQNNDTDRGFCLNHKERDRETQRVFLERGEGVCIAGKRRWLLTPSPLGFATPKEPSWGSHITSATQPRNPSLRTVTQDEDGHLSRCHVAGLPSLAPGNLAGPRGCRAGGRGGGRGRGQPVAGRVSRLPCDEKEEEEGSTRGRNGRAPLPPPLATPTRGDDAPGDPADAKGHLPGLVAMGVSPGVTNGEGGAGGPTFCAARL